MAEVLKDFLGEKVYDNLINQLGEYVTTAQEAGLLNLQPWSEFFSKFKAPKHWRKEDIEKRITVNFGHYKANYAAICTAIIALMLVTSPLLLTVLLLCGGLWFYAIVQQPGSITLGQTTLDENKKLIGCGVVTMLVLVFSGQFLKLLGTITLAALLAVAHMVFRQRHVKSKATHAGNVILGGLFNKASQKKKDKLDDDMEGGGLGNGAQDENNSHHHPNNPNDQNCHPRNVRLRTLARYKPIYTILPLVVLDIVPHGA